jgi:hypothetical protein
MLGFLSGLKHQQNVAKDSAAIFKEKRYLFLQDLLPECMVSFLATYCEILIANNKFSTDDQCPLSLSLGGDPALDAVLEWIRPEIQALLGVELVPTYSYARRYAKGEILERHTDRASCEVSVSVSLTIPEGGAPSTLFLSPPNSGEIKIEMLEGDACLYAGTEVEHWRRPFTASGYLQLFLHFITHHGVNFPQWAFDRRPRLGL